LLQKPSFWLLAGQDQRLLVSLAGGNGLTQPAEHIGPSSVGQVIIGQIAAGQDGVDER
jgi:hypothetical protein